jgi:hypothetical protein
LLRIQGARRSTLVVCAGVFALSTRDFDSARAGAEPKLRALSEYAELQVVLDALLESFEDEKEFLRWLNICLEEVPHWKKIDQNELLFQCMCRFPRDTSLLDLLFDLGLSASAKIAHRVCDGWQAEETTILIRAILAKPIIENDPIFVPLARGGDIGLLHAYNILRLYLRG